MMVLWSGQHLPSVPEMISTRFAACEDGLIAQAQRPSDRRTGCITTPQLSEGSIPNQSGRQGRGEAHTADTREELDS
jgi:hypothetical protein